MPVQRQQWLMNSAGLGHSGWQSQIPKLPVSWKVLRMATHTLAKQCRELPKCKIKLLWLVSDDSSGGGVKRGGGGLQVDQVITLRLFVFVSFKAVLFFMCHFLLKMTVKGCQYSARPVCGAATLPQAYTTNRKQGMEHSLKPHTSSAHIQSTNRNYMNIVFILSLIVPTLTRKKEKIKMKNKKPLL